MEYNVLGVIFNVTKKRYFFEIKKEDKTTYKKGDHVIVDTARGQELGTVYAEASIKDEKELVLPLKPVIKKASKEEYDYFLELRKEADSAFDICKKKIFEHELPMKLVTSEYTYDKSKLIFYFTAEGRIDFRKLVKDLAAIFKLRIELRQIGVRDEARILGSVGLCGVELCCRKFINKFDSVSIKMAREQGLVINPSKISGACGRLLCCIKYEYSQYVDELKKYPAVNQIVETPLGSGKVTTVNPLNDYMYIEIPEKGINKFSLREIRFDLEEANSLKNNHYESDEKIDKDLLKKLEEE
ncbi:cell fate regulator YaaT (PSP1 superfamily) [Hypnocyclicus thermotrophus]|uniref:Cell fate regulator YaaT (PSP1 superfamily) n=1 Tax=Hypnocyclicus thermotrophus TaxID=1627895 RepID=A0AA46DZN1_9FUSO|nr:stage 0 sporulation family protein [Hypnocyclicus thermotrophus]TDT71917.1 cell fate regulator YaaT (PSP1 superfamily) [Hypnocyclicus thermotrophus]